MNREALINFNLFILGGWAIAILVTIMGKVPFSYLLYGSIFNLLALVSMMYSKKNAKRRKSDE